MTELYPDAALIPASPWLGKTAPPVPTARVSRDSVSGEDVLTVTPGPSARWITVRIARNGTWTSQVLPASFRRLSIGTADSAPADQIVVTVVNRTGIESAPRMIRSVP